MKKSSKASKTVMSDGMFMNSSSSHESHSDDEKCHLPTADSILSNHQKDDVNDNTQVVVRRRNTNRLRRQQATTSLQLSLSFRNISSLESVDNDGGGEDNDDHPSPTIVDQTTIKGTHPTGNDLDQNINRTSFNESERTDSGIGRDSGSSWRFSGYSESFHQSPSHQQPVSKQEGMSISLNTIDVFRLE